MAVPKTTEFTDPTGRRVTVKDLSAQLRPSKWQRRACGIGTKGYRVYDWEVINSGHPDHQYMIRRSIDDGELAFYHCYNPRHEPAGELVRVAGTRWPIEECFQTGKGHLGLDNYQVRLYHAWYRHITLGHALPHIPRHTCPPPSREKRGSTSGGPAAGTHTAPDKKTTSATQVAPTSPLQQRNRLALAEVRRLFNVRDQAKQLIHTAMGWSTYRRQHQAEARRHHFRRRLKIQTLAL